MALEQPRNLRRRLFLRAVLGLAYGISIGCEAEWASTRTKGGPRTIGSFHVAGDGMYEGFERWRANATKEERAVIDELIGRKDLLIHVILAVGRISDQLSRGGVSGFASYEEIKKYCDFHPIVGKFPPELNWDVIYDRQLTDAFEEQYGIPTPVEVMLQHEIFGHVLPALRDPDLEERIANDKRLRDANECEALAMENSYRRRIGLREVPPKLVGCSSP